MKKQSLVLLTIAAVAAMSFTLTTTKFVSSNVHISFYSHTPLEDINSNNYKVVSTIESTSGDVVFSVPMQSFEFEKELMQQHFNSPGFLDTKKYPKAKFVGRITNIDRIDFSKNGTYNASIHGDLTIKDVTRPIDATGNITVTGNEFSVKSKMNITLADYNITFKKGKPSTNLAKTIEVTTEANYSVQ